MVNLVYSLVLRLMAGRSSERKYPCVVAGQTGCANRGTAILRFIAALAHCAAFPASAESILPVPLSVPASVLGRLSEAEAERFRAGVAACWNVGALSDPARQAIVEVELDLTPEAKPVGETIRLVRPLNPAQAHSQAFEAARRAILRCAGDGHPLPREDYALWRSMILTFDARRMR